MIVLLDTSEALDVCASELGLERGEVKQLVTPAPGFRRQKEHDEFAIDNGFFANPDPTRFFTILEREKEAKHLCKFVAVPDVPGSARRTGELFNFYKYKLTGWPLAFVVQNGQEDEPIPWKHIQAIFIGGLDKKDGAGDWKLGVNARECIRCAKGMGKWVHAGRVNTPGRYDYFKDLGVDSIDGTGLAQYTHMRTDIRDYQHNLLANLGADLVEQQCPKRSFL
jgi:hypothetical protein